MRVTKAQLVKLGACSEAIEKYYTQPKRKSYEASALLELAIKNKDYGMAQWGLAHLMTHTQQITWAIHCADYAVHIYESKYPGDDQPRKAIAAAREYLKNPCVKTRTVARAAAYAAARAAAYAADAAARAAAYAADAARAAAYAAAYAAADAAADAAAYAAADAARAAAYVGYDKTRANLLRAGLAILEGRAP